MAQFLHGVANVLNTLGAPLFIPAIIFVFALIFGVRASKAFRSAIMIAVGLTVIWWVLNPFIAGMGQAVGDMVKNSGVHLPIVDIGWGSTLAVAYSTLVGGALTIPIGIIVNLIMLALKWTDTFDIDLFNYWCWSLASSLVYFATNNLWYSILTVVACAMYSFITADITQPVMEDAYGYPGISYPHFQSQGPLLLAIPINWLLDKIGLGNVKLNSDTIREKIGVLGDTPVLGFILGIVIALLAWGKTKTNSLAGWVEILTVGITVAGVFFLLPKAVGAFMEGLVPISESIRDNFKKRGYKRKIYFGMDVAITVGDPDILATDLLLTLSIVPLMLLLPGNRFLCLADLGLMPMWILPTILAITNKNILKSWIISVIYVIFGFYAANYTAPLFTKALIAIGKKSAIPAGTSLVNAMSHSFFFLNDVFYWMGKTPIRLGILFALLFLLLFSFRKHKHAWYKITGHNVAEETQKEV